MSVNISRRPRQERCPLCNHNFSFQSPLFGGGGLFISEGVHFERGAAIIGKGSNRRPTLITREQENLNYKLAFGHITFEEYAKRKKQLEKEGKWGRKRGF